MMAGCLGRRVEPAFYAARATTWSPPRPLRRLIHVVQAVLGVKESRQARGNVSLGGRAPQRRALRGRGGGGRHGRRLRLISQTQRRVLYGESVPAQDKIVSIFEPHTDIIVKDRRETLYGHKVCLTMGASGMVTDVAFSTRPSWMGYRAARARPRRGGKRSAPRRSRAVVIVLGVPATERVP